MNHEEHGTILPPGYRWLAPPNIMVGDFHGFLPDGEVNVYYKEHGQHGAWGRIERNDFAPGELNQLELGCKIERFCGDITGPEGKKFIIRARKASWYTPTIKVLDPPIMKRAISKTNRQTIYHVIWLHTGQCIIGFHYPPKLHNYNEPEPNEGFYDPTTGQCYPSGSKYIDPAENEIAISETCYAVLGNERPYKFNNQEAAKHIASAIPGAKVELWED